MYGAKLREELPINMPDERVIGFYMTTYVDSDHTGDTLARRSRKDS